MKISSFISKYNDISNGYIAIKKKDINNKSTKNIFENITNSVVIDCTQYCTSINSGCDDTVIYQIIDKVLSMGRVPIIKRPELMRNNRYNLLNYRSSNKFIIFTEDGSFLEYANYKCDYVGDALKDSL